MSSHKIWNALHPQDLEGRIMISPLSRSHKQKGVKKSMYFSVQINFCPSNIAIYTGRGGLALIGGPCSLLQGPL